MSNPILSWFRKAVRAPYHIPAQYALENWPLTIGIAVPDATAEETRVARKVLARLAGWPGVPFEHGRYTRDSGDVGGDNAVGITPSRRFAQRQSDGTWLVITDYAMAYVQDFDITPRVYDLQNVVEVMRCGDLDDPGSSEITCDYEYEWIGNVGYTSIKKAEQAAARYVRNLDIRHYLWEV